MGVFVYFKFFFDLIQFVCVILFDWFKYWIMINFIGVYIMGRFLCCVLYMLMVFMMFCDNLFSEIVCWGQFGNIVIG